MGRITNILQRLSAATGIAATIFAALTPANAFAASGNIYFGGDITYNNACIIIIGNPGTIVPNVTGDQLSSKLPGGQQGTASVYSLTRYEVSVSSPGFFTTSPQGGSDNVTFTTTFSGQSLYRGRTFGERPGDNPVRLRNGFSVTEVSVDLVADRTSVFPAGNYTAQTTVRCE